MKYFRKLKLENLTETFQLISKSLTVCCVKLWKIETRKNMKILITRKSIWLCLQNISVQYITCENF